MNYEVASGDGRNEGIVSIGAAIKEADRVELVEDILTKRERVIEWLSRHCIYYEVSGRHFGSDKH